MNSNNFDCLRFVFAFIVVLRHIIDLSQNKRLAVFEPFFNSYLSVTGFFIISGFLIWKSYEKTNNRFQYFEKRARRLLPAYVTFVVFASLILVICSELTIADYFTNTSFYTYLLSNLSFLNFIQPCLPGVFIHNWQCAVNGALWTIKVEVLFYLTVPILYYFFAKTSKKYTLMTIVYCLSILYKNYLEDTGDNIFTILSRQTPGFLSYFICGISFYYYFDFYHKYKTKLLIGSVIVFTIETYFEMEILTPFAYSMILFYVAYSFPKLNNFGKYGDFSYGIYIYHFTLIQIFVQYNLFELYNPFILSTIIILLVVGTAVLSWNYIEKPFLKKRTLPV